jgi:two-component sensor histidine kinase
VVIVLMKLLDQVGRLGQRSLNSVRGRLVLLTVSLLVPALLSMAFLLISADRQGRAQRDEQMLATARALSGAVDRQAAVGIAVTETLASDQALQAGDLAGFHARAVRATSDRPGWVVVTDLSGQQVLNTLRPFGVPLPRSVRAPELTRALLAGRSKVSDLRQGLVSKRPVVTVVTPVSIKGKPYIVSYVVEAESFASVFRELRVRDRWIATLLDNKQTVLARSSGGERWIGKSASPDMIENMRRAHEGIIYSRSLDGTPTRVAYTRSAQTGWTLLVAIPRADFNRTITISVLSATGIFLLLLLLGGLLAMFVSKRINLEVGRLVSDAGAIGRGEPVASTGAEGLEEIAAVHTALRDASAELKAREDRQTVMINELNHRVKNTLATVQALARQTFGKAESAKVEVFTERLIALSGAHDLLTRTGWREADLGGLMQACMRAHGDRVACDGPSVALDPHTAVALSMVFHEMATNSAKYGALSAAGGTVAIVWRVDPEGENLTFTWSEHGGPPVVAPGLLGFGIRLIDSSIRRELKGRPHFDFKPDGLVFTASIPLSGAVRWTNPY